MRNQGKFLTRAPVTEPDSEPDAEEENKGGKLVKRQRLDDKGNSRDMEVMDSESISENCIVFDVYPDKQSFQHKTNVENHIVLWLQDEVDFEQLKEIK